MCVLGAELARNLNNWEIALFLKDNRLRCLLAQG
jgi:hypothetical protein